MPLTETTIENRLAIMTIGDQDDLREKLHLQRALAELRDTDKTLAGALAGLDEIPRRGRRRKIGAIAH